MGWSFRESIKILPGIRLNFSRRGVGASIGVKGLHIGVGGGRAPRLTGGIGPLHYYQSLGTKRGEHHYAPTVRRRRSHFGLLATVVVLVGLLVGWMMVPPRWISSHLRAAAPTWFARSEPAPPTTEPTTVLPGSTTVHHPAGAPVERHPAKAEAAKRRAPSHGEQTR